MELTTNSNVKNLLIDVSLLLGVDFYKIHEIQNYAIKFKIFFFLKNYSFKSLCVYKDN